MPKSPPMPVILGSKEILLMLVLTVTLSMHHLMKSAPTELSTLELLRRKEIPHSGSPNGGVIRTPFGPQVNNPVRKWTSRPALSYEATGPLVTILPYILPTVKLSAATPHSIRARSALDRNNSASWPRGFCLVMLVVLPPSSFLQILPPRSVFPNKKIEFLQTFMFAPLNDSFFDLVITLFHLRLGDLGTFSVCPGYIAWYDALYIYYHRRIFRVIFLVFHCLFGYGSRFLLFGPLLCLVSLCAIFFGLFGWLFSLVIQYCPSFRNLVLSNCLFVSLYFFCSGTCSWPLSITLLLILFLDYRAYDSMIVEHPLADLRRSVISLLACPGDEHKKITSAYQFLKNENIALPIICWEPSISFGGKSCTRLECYRQMHLAMLKELDLLPAFSQTAQDCNDNFHYFDSGRFHSIGRSQQYISLIANFFGLGISPIAGQFIQDALLFAGKVVYIATDTRVSRHLAMQAEILQFRNSPLGITMHAKANEWFHEFMTEAFQTIMEIVPEGRRLAKQVYEKSPGRFFNFNYVDRKEHEIRPLGSVRYPPMIAPYWKREPHNYYGDPEDLDEDVQYGSKQSQEYQNRLDRKEAWRMFNERMMNAKFSPTAIDISVSGMLGMLGGLDKTLRSQVLKKVFQIVAVLIAVVSFSRSGEFSKEGMTRMVAAMRAHPFDDSVDMASYLVSLLKWAAESGWNVFRFSATEVFSPDTVISWKDDADILLLVRKCPGYKECFGNGLLDLEGKPLPLSVIRSRVLKMIKIDWPPVEAALKITSSKFVMAEFKQVKNQLTVFESELATKIMSQRFRRAPFGIAIVGGTSIGKSNISNLLFSYMSALRGIDHLTEMIYSCSPFSKFYDTFTGNDYLLLDDVGSAHPQGKAIDESLAHILQLSNNAPFIVPMAAVDDKGSQCVTAVGLIATSNVLDLGARFMFATPAAIYRRFAIWLELSVRPEFADRQGKLCPIKVEAFWQSVDLSDETLPYTRLLPPYWRFDIHETGDTIGAITHTFDGPSGLVDFFEYFKIQYRAHENQQDRVMKTHTEMKSLDLCKTCQIPKRLCRGIGLCAPAVFAQTALGDQPAIDDDDDEPEVILIVTSWSYYVKRIFLAVIALVAAFYYMRSLIVIFLVCHAGVAAVKLAMNRYRDTCSLCDTVRLPIFIVNRIFSSFGSAYEEFSQFATIVIVGRGSRASFSKACLHHAFLKLRRVVTAKNVIILGLIVCLIQLLRQPAFKILSHTFTSTGGDEEALPGKAATPTVSEDSRSAYYNPYPSVDSRTDKTRCLSDASSATFVENTIRRHTCNITVVRKDGSPLRVKGLAIGGTLLLTVAHALCPAYDGTPKSLESCVDHGSVVFNSSIEGREAKSSFQITPNSIFMNIQDDWAIIDVPSMPPRKSLVDYFLEFDHSFPTTLDRAGKLEYSDICTLVDPEGLNPAIAWTKRFNQPVTAGAGKQHVPGYLTGNSFLSQMSDPSSFGKSGSAFVSRTNGVSILGIQCASADTDKTIVISTFVGRSQLKDAIRKLTSKSVLNQFSDISKNPIVDQDMRVPLQSSTPTRSNPLNFGSLSEMNFTFTATLLAASGTPSSSFAYPPYREFFRERGYICDKEKPRFDYKSKRHYLEQVSNISSSIDITRVEVITKCLTDHWIFAYGDELKLLETLSLSDAINGNDHVTWVERLKMNTSAGFPWNKRKSEFLEVKEVPSTERLSGFEYYLNPLMHGQFCSYFSGLMEGSPLNYAYKGTQKDEAISPDKNQSRGPRMFCAASLYVIIAGRMLFGAYIRIAQRNPFISWAAVGMNASSKVWGLLWKFISHFGADRIIAGDYSNFDQNMSPVFTRAAYSIIIALMLASKNFCPGEIRAAQSWAAEAIYPTIIIDGDIFTVAGTNPSGNPLTVHINCIVNILFIMYVWIGVGNDIGDFFLCVRMMTYGDDNLINVANTIDNFNYSTIHIHLAMIGVKYTPADKSVAIDGKKFDEPGEIAFLKRYFVLVDGYCLAPLDFSSISKTLNCWMASKEEDEKHGLATLVSVWENACHYNADVRTRIHSDILDCCAYLGWSTEVFVPFQNIIDRFHTAEVNRYEILALQADLVFSPTAFEVSYQSLYFENFSFFVQEFPSLGFHGLAFSIEMFCDTLRRWYAVQDGSWYQALVAREHFQVTHGPGAFPLVDQTLLIDEDDDLDLVVGSFDSFRLVEGPEGDENLSLPLGPS